MLGQRRYKDEWIDAATAGDSLRSICLVVQDWSRRPC